MTEQEVVALLERARWPHGTDCPYCKTMGAYKTNRGWKCSNSKCYRKFTIRTKTIWEDSKVPMRKWWSAHNLLIENPRINSMELSAKIGVAHKTACRLIRKINKTDRLETPLRTARTPEEKMNRELDRILSQIEDIQSKL